MQTDYLYMHDVLYALTDDVKIIFKTVAATTTNGKSFSNCTEFKLYNTKEYNTMIKRTMTFYLFIDDRREVKNKKINIFPEHMLNLLSAMEYAKKAWFTDSFTMYGYLNGSLTVINEDCRIIKLAFDDVIKIAPGIYKHELGDTPCVNIYLNTSDPVQISIETFDGLYYILANLDMAGYANTALSFMMLKNEPSNRVDYSTNNISHSNISITDKSTASGSGGRSFNSKKQGMLD